MKSQAGLSISWLAAGFLPRFSQSPCWPLSVLTHPPKGESSRIRPRWWNPPPSLPWNGNLPYVRNRLCPSESQTMTTDVPACLLPMRLSAPVAKARYAPNGLARHPKSTRICLFPAAYIVSRDNCSSLHSETNRRASSTIHHGTKSKCTTINDLTIQIKIRFFRFDAVRMPKYATFVLQFCYPIWYE